MSYIDLDGLEENKPEEVDGVTGATIPVNSSSEEKEANIPTTVYKIQGEIKYDYYKGDRINVANQYKGVAESITITGIKVIHNENGNGDTLYELNVQIATDWSPWVPQGSGMKDVLMQAYDLGILIDNSLTVANSMLKNTFSRQLDLARIGAAFGVI